MSLRKLAAAAQVISVLAADKSAPTVTNVNYDRKVVAGTKLVTSLTAADESGVSRVNFNSYPSQGWWFPCTKPFSLTNGTAFSGTWTVECDIPLETPNGQYGFSYDAYDTVGNHEFKQYRLGFDVVGGATPDYDPPVVVKTSYPTTFTAGGAYDVFLTLKDASGVKDGYMVVRATTGYYSACTAYSITLDSGSMYDGVWKASCTIPTEAPNGEYWLEIHVNDNQKNPKDLFIYHAFNLSGGAKADLIPPSISNIAFSNSKPKRGETIQITAKVSDAQTGVNRVDFWAKQPYAQVMFCRGPMSLANGDRSSGTWSYTCTIPADAQISYHTANVEAYDNQNNLGYATAGFNIEY
jgi:hypothetical protein